MMGMLWSDDDYMQMKAERDAADSECGRMGETIAGLIDERDAALANVELWKAHQERTKALKKQFQAERDAAYAEGQRFMDERDAALVRLNRLEKKYEARKQVSLEWQASAQRVIDAARKIRHDTVPANFGASPLDAALADHDARYPKEDK